MEEGQKLMLFDAGCGVGNGFYPLYKEYLGKILVNACDFSPRAVDFVKQNELYDPAFVDAKTCDLVNEVSFYSSQYFRKFPLNKDVLTIP